MLLSLMGGVRNVSTIRPVRIGTTVLINLAVPFGNSTFITRERETLSEIERRETGSRNTVCNLLRSHVRVDPNENFH